MRLLVTASNPKLPRRRRSRRPPDVQPARPGLWLNDDKTQRWWDDVCSNSQLSLRLNSGPSGERPDRLRSIC